MDITLSATEARILGCLIEKQATTPDTYPLTLNSLLLACNQKSSRDPVMELEESGVLEALDSLTEKTLASPYQSNRDRMPKYQHRLHQRAFDEFNFSNPELAVLCLLFLRGPQTPGEIRNRCSRIHEFPDPGSVVETLRQLEENPHGPYVVMLPRQAGRKESRYAHLFCGPVDEFSAPAGSPPGESTNREPGGALEQEVAELREKLADLERRFEEFMRQFE